MDDFIAHDKVDFGDTFSAVSESVIPDDVIVYRMEQGGPNWCLQATSFCGPIPSWSMRLSNGHVVCYKGIAEVKPPFLVRDRISYWSQVTECIRWLRTEDCIDENQKQKYIFVSRQISAIELS